MKPADRYEWILQWMDKNEQRQVDVLDRYFVDAYIGATEAAFTAVSFGADKCPQLGRDLSKMKKRGFLKRHAIGVGGMCGMGFPKWVWSYEKIAKRGGV